MNGIVTTKTFIIAEAGVNHNGSLDIAQKIVDKAKNAGVDAIKFQTFKAEKIVSIFAKKANYQRKNTRKAESQLEMIKKLELSFENFITLKKYCDEKNILFLSTPYDPTSVDFLENLVPLYKIGSGEITNLPFLEYVARKGKPIILSTGMSTLGEVEEAVNIILPILSTSITSRKSKYEPLTLLHCVSRYPAGSGEANLRAMITLRKAFGLPVGYSDHTLGIEIPIAAVALGARIIEKHFTLDKNMPGPDHKASLESHELKELVRAVRSVEKSLGNGKKEPTHKELIVKIAARRSLTATRDIKAGEIIKKTDIEIKRPGEGIPPKFKELIIGMRLVKGIKKDEQFHWRSFK